MTATLVGLLVGLGIILTGLLLGILGAVLAKHSGHGPRLISVFSQYTGAGMVILGLVLSFLFLAIRSLFYPGHPMFR